MKKRLIPRPKQIIKRSKQNGRANLEDGHDEKDLMRLFLLREANVSGRMKNRKREEGCEDGENVFHRTTRPVSRRANGSTVSSNR